jgi:hypothetical protein
MKTRQKSQRGGNGAARQEAVAKEKQEQEQERAYEEFCEKLRTQLAKADQDDMRARYETGRLVLAAMDKSKYGQKAVKRAAKEVGRDVDTLYQYKSVADAWSKEEFEALVQRKGKTGTPLSFNHLVVLAKVKEPTRRDELVEQAFRDALHVRALKTLVKAVSTGKEPSLANVAAYLRRVINQAKKWSDVVRNQVAETAVPKQEQQLDSIADALDELRSELEHLDKAIQHGREPVSQDLVLDAPERSVGGTKLLRDVPENGGSAQAEVAVGDGTYMGHENA